MGTKANGLDGLAFDSKFLLRFWQRVGIAAPDQCWEWLGALNNMGYGMVWFRPKGGPVLVHHVAYACRHGRVEPRMEILHSCDNPRCVNPFHLRQGTHAENLRECVLKGRQIRRRAVGETTYALSREFGVSQSYVSALRLRKARQHVQEK